MYGTKCQFAKLVGDSTREMILWQPATWCEIEFGAF